MIPAPAVRGGGFKACCLTSGRYDGAERKDYFQGVTRRRPRERLMVSSAKRARRTMRRGLTASNFTHHRERMSFDTLPDCR